MMIWQKRETLSLDTDDRKIQSGEEKKSIFVVYVTFLQRIRILPTMPSHPLATD
jgi:hypothetical protein